MSNPILVWVDLTPDHYIAQARRRGTYVARRLTDDDRPDRWELSGPQGKAPWTVGTLEQVQDSADFVEQRALAKQAK